MLNLFDNLNQTCALRAHTSLLMESTYLNYKYRQTKRGVVLTEYTGDETHVEIPASVYGMPVVSFGDIFSYNENLQSVVIPDSFTVIPPNAFDSCSNLRHVHIGNGVKRIAADAFSYCTSLEHVDVPQNVESIGVGAFARSGLISITLHEGLKIIDEQAFCESALRRITIPNSVTELGYIAFYASKIEYVTLGSGITTLNSTFSESSLREVNIPRGVVSINMAFRDCRHLRKVYVEDRNGWFVKDPASEYNPEKYGDRAYACAPKLFATPKRAAKAFRKGYNGEIYSSYWFKAKANNVAKPVDAVCTVDDFDYEETDDGIRLIKYNGNATIVSVPKQIDDMAVYDLGSAFGGTQIESITLPPSVKHVYAYAFFCCSELKRIEMPEVETIGDKAFEFCKKLQELSLPNSLLSIGKDAFHYCGVTTIKLGTKLKEIKAGAFNCKKLQRVYFTQKYGWRVHTPKGEQLIDERDLADPISATQLLRKYGEYDWTREGLF